MRRLDCKSSRFRRRCLRFLWVRLMTRMDQPTGEAAESPPKATLIQNRAAAALCAALALTRQGPRPCLPISHDLPYPHRIPTSLY